jgi:hypothetical protein
MVNDDLGFRTGVGQICNLAKLRVVGPDIDSQTETPKAANRLAKRREIHPARSWLPGAESADRAGVMLHKIAHAAKTSLASRDMSVRDGLNPIAKLKIDMADDGSGDLASVNLRTGFRRDELGFTDSPKRFGPARPIMRMGVDENGLLDAMTSMQLPREID